MNTHRSFRVLDMDSVVKPSPETSFPSERTAASRAAPFRENLNPSNKFWSGSGLESPSVVLFMSENAYVTKVAKGNTKSCSGSPWSDHEPSVPTSGYPFRQSSSVKQRDACAHACILHGTSVINATVLPRLSLRYGSDALHINYLPWRHLIVKCGTCPLYLLPMPQK